MRDLLKSFNNIMPYNMSLENDVWMHGVFISYWIIYGLEDISYRIVAQFRVKR